MLLSLMFSLLLGIGQATAPATTNATATPPPPPPNPIYEGAGVEATNPLFGS
jgi:hypothetical protein